MGASGPMLGGSSVDPNGIAAAAPAVPTPTSAPDWWAKAANQPFGGATTAPTGTAPAGLAAPTAVPFNQQAPTAPALNLTPQVLTGSAAPAETGSASDWVYAGDLPPNMLGMGWGASPTPLNYGALGGFGGVSGRGGDTAKWGQPLPALAAGTKLEGSQVDQYNRIARSEYDRYMKLYGVGYDKQGYENAISNQMMQYQLPALAPGGGTAWSSGG